MLGICAVWTGQGDYWGLLASCFRFSETCLKGMRCGSKAGVREISGCCIPLYIHVHVYDIQTCTIFVQMCVDNCAHVCAGMYGEA